MLIVLFLCINFHFLKILKQNRIYLDDSTFDSLLTFHSPGQCLTLVLALQANTEAIWLGSGWLSPRLAKALVREPELRSASESCYFFFPGAFLSFQRSSIGLYFSQVRDGNLQNYSSEEVFANLGFT